jgi:glutathione S-transferase
MSEPTSKRQKTQPVYTLLYHGGIPGRGEFIRLAFESRGMPYIDAGNGTPDQQKSVYAPCSPTSLGIDGNPPGFSPPMLRVEGAGKNGKDLIISQTSNILLYIGPELDLVGEDEVDKFHVNQLTLTALDLNNETHDTHHPIANMKYYEDQKEEALKKSVDFRQNRIPKFFNYFERTLKGNEAGKGKYLVGAKLTYADLTFWHVVDGLHYAFPKACDSIQKNYPLIFESFYTGIKEETGVKEYLASERRLPYSMGIFRHYPELDKQ